MKYVLPYLDAPESFERGLEADLNAWWREVLFGPLLAIFDGDRNNSAGSEDWEEFPPWLNSLGLSRERMPQIRSEDRRLFASFASTRRIPSVETRIAAEDLRPTQALYSPAKVEAARRWHDAERPILVSSDLRIVDGHHQWFAWLLDFPEEPILAIVFDAPIRRMIEVAHAFPGSVRNNSVESDASALAAALRSRKIEYAGGRFAGKFSAETSRALKAIGAEFDRGTKTFALPEGRLPIPLRALLSEARARSKAIHEEVRERLRQIEENLSKQDSVGLKIADLTEKAVRDLEAQFQGSLAEARPFAPSVPEASAEPIIDVEPAFNPEDEEDTGPSNRREIPAKRPRGTRPEVPPPPRGTGDQPENPKGTAPRPPANPRPPKIGVVKAREIIGVGPDFSLEMVADVARTLTNNLDLAVKNFTNEEVLKLREIAEANYFAGGRVERLQEEILKRFDVTKRKARFLAKQETSMIAAEYSRARAEEIGSTEYVWHCRDDGKVRPDHKLLDGTTQRWANPPVVDRARGRHRNPGLDYGCRCRGRPILNLAAARIG